VGCRGQEAVQRRGEGRNGGTREPEPQTERGLEGRHAHELLLRRVRIHLPEARLHVLRLAFHDQSLVTSRRDVMLFLLLATNKPDAVNIYAVVLSSLIIIFGTTCACSKFLFY
jgi:hypothetical protein